MLATNGPALQVRCLGGLLHMSIGIEAADVLVLC